MADGHQGGYRWVDIPLGLLPMRSAALGRKTMRRLIHVMTMLILTAAVLAACDSPDLTAPTNGAAVKARCANRACSGPRVHTTEIPTTTTTVMSAQFTPGPTVVEYIDRGRLVHCTDFGEWGWCDDIGEAPVR